MNTAQAIAKMIETAAPVTKAYWNDIAADACLLAYAPDTSTYLWSPVECGSRIILLQRGDAPNARAAELFDAMRPHVTQWYYICVDMGDFAPVSYEDAEMSAQAASQRAYNARDAGEEYVSEIHL